MTSLLDIISKEKVKNKIKEFSLPFSTSSNYMKVTKVDALCPANEKDKKL